MPRSWAGTCPTRSWWRLQPPLRQEAAGSGTGTAELESELFDERDLIRRPVLRALSAPAGSPPPVLVIDEIDRGDEELEAYLLEALSTHSVSVPEMGTFTATVPGSGSS